jgi:hypothetical protein
MDRPLNEHISQLELRLHKLKKELMDSARTREERNRIESEIRVATLALDYYRKALELESQISANPKAKTRR